MRSIATYVICTSPRSGSTLLCDLLASTGVAGNPGSWFHRPSLDDWARGLHVSRREDDEAVFVSRLFEAARELGSGSGNVFGLRLQRHSFAFFFETLRSLHSASSSDVESFERSFGPTLYIHLFREDKVEQAVSYVRAQQSGLWHVAADGSELERAAPPHDPHYDAGAIKAQVEVFTEFDRLWSAWFRQERIKPMRLSYARLADDPVMATRDLLEHLGVDPGAADHIEPGVSKMADAITEDWVSRFQAEASSGWAHATIRRFAAWRATESRPVRAGLHGAPAWDVPELPRKSTLLPCRCSRDLPMRQTSWPYRRRRCQRVRESPGTIPDSGIVAI